MNCFNVKHKFGCKLNKNEDDVKDRNVEYLYCVDEMIVSKHKIAYIVQSEIMSRRTMFWIFVYFRKS